MLDSGGNQLEDSEVKDRLQKGTSKHLIKKNIWYFMGQVLQGGDFLRFRVISFFFLQK